MPHPFKVFQNFEKTVWKGQKLSVAVPSFSAEILICHVCDCWPTDGSFSSQSPLI